MPPPASSDAAPPEPTAPTHEALIATAIHIADLGVYGIAWLDAGLVTRARFGRLVDRVAIGEPVSDSLPPLFGLEADILALRDQPGRVLELAGVAMAEADRMGPRLNFTVFWHAPARSFLLLVYRTGERTDVELELTRQVRGRLIAEEQLREKSEALARANVELEVANRDLEQYATIISHDINAPLRALRYDAGDARDALAAGDAAAADALLDRIATRTRRLSAMMAALLDYASARRKSDAATEVDTRALVETVAASLPRPPGFRVDISGDWPRFETLEAPLDLVLRNLVDNALKHHDRDHGTISLSARDEGPTLAIRVADDGPGIAPEHQAVVFLPFRRLAPEGSGAAPHGAGMGLTLVRRTVETVGGTIRIVSSPAERRGTTFEICWPKCLPRDVDAPAPAGDATP